MGHVGNNGAERYEDIVAAGSLEGLERSQDIIRQMRSSGQLMTVPPPPTSLLTGLHPAVVVLLNALIAPENDRQRLAVAVLMGDDVAAMALVDKVKEEVSEAQG